MTKDKILELKKKNKDVTIKKDASAPEPTKVADPKKSESTKTPTAAERAEEERSRREKFERMSEEEKVRKLIEQDEDIELYRSDLSKMTKDRDSEKARADQNATDGVTIKRAYEKLESSIPDKIKEAVNQATEDSVKRIKELETGGEALKMVSTEAFCKSLISQIKKAYDECDSAIEAAEKEYNSECNAAEKEYNAECTSIKKKYNKRCKSAEEEYSSAVDEARMVRDGIISEIYKNELKSVIADYEAKEKRELERQQTEADRDEAEAQAEYWQKKCEEENKKLESFNEA